MPPKPRGRGSTRARGGARGGATAGRDTAGDNTENATTPQSATAAAATEAPAEPAVAKAENDDAEPPIAGEDVELTTESKASPSVVASYAMLFRPHTDH
jgi:DNA-directed RNA polymerase III subunit RPC4